VTPKQTTFEGDFRMEKRGAPLTELIEELYGSDVWPETVDGEPLAEWLGGGELPEPNPPGALQLDRMTRIMVEELTGEEGASWDAARAMNALAREVRVRQEGVRW
jgi:hypothetical protein